MNFNQNLMQQLFEDRGQNIGWERAQMCHCLHGGYLSETGVGQADPTCSDCQGYGWTYAAMQVFSQCLLTKITPELVFPKVMVAEQGEMVLTVPPLINDGGEYITNPLFEKISLFDRITILDIDMIERESVLRDEDKVFWNISSIVEVASGTTVYNENTDFKIDGQNIAWITAGPAANSRYSVTYKYNPQYVVMTQLEQPRRSFTEFLPSKYVLSYRKTYGVNVQ